MLHNPATDNVAKQPMNMEQTTRDLILYRNTTARGQHIHPNCAHFVKSLELWMETEKRHPQTRFSYPVWSLLLYYRMNMVTFIEVPKDISTSFFMISGNK
jgi:hypothetical protein